jgi:hypothetical protein
MKFEPSAAAPCCWLNFFYEMKTLQNQKERGEVFLYVHVCWIEGKKEGRRMYMRTQEGPPYARNPF